MKTKLFSTLALIALLCGSALAQEKTDPKLTDALTAMKEKAVALGAPKADGISLFFGASRLNGNYEIVDAIKEKYGAVATFFVKKGDAYIRVSTNIQKEGNRAVGSKLDPAGKPFAAIIKGETFQGDAVIFGNKYNSIYEPIKNDKNEVVGIYYVGIPD